MPFEQSRGRIGSHLHDLLHFEARICGLHRPFLPAELIQPVEAVLRRFRLQLWERCVGLNDLLDTKSGGTAEHDNIEERVGTCDRQLR